MIAPCLTERTPWKKRRRHNQTAGRSCETLLHGQAQISNAAKAQPDSRSIALPGSQLAAAIWKMSCNTEILPTPAPFLTSCNIKEARGTLHEHQGFKSHSHGPFLYVHGQELAVVLCQSWLTTLFTS